MSPSQQVFNIMLGVLVNAIRQGKEIRSLKIGKEEMKLSLFTNDMIVFVENPKESTTQTQEYYSTLKKI